MSVRAVMWGLLMVLLAAGCSQRPAGVVFKIPGTVSKSQPAPASVSPPSAAAPAQVPPTVAVAPVPVPASIVIRRGDTVYAIARRYNIPVRAIIDGNGLGPPYTLKVGQRVVLPHERIHPIAKGDTVYAISRRYGVDIEALARANRLVPPYRLRVGQHLRIPAAPTSGGAVVRTALGSATAAPPPPAPAGKTPTATAALSVAPIPKPPPRTKKTFLWPVSGKVVSRFGVKPDGLRNDGINITAPRGAAVRAAEDGVVAYAGNELGGYGNLLLLRHAGGWTTAYAHNDSLLVRRGDVVRRGQVIAHVGASGSVSEPQAHFELRRGSRAVDPLKHLARK